MKKLLVIIDGMEDVPIPDLDGKTPLEFADMPSLCLMKRTGTCFSQKTIPDYLDAVTDVALLTILGYELDSSYSSRSWFEAIGHGISVDENDLCLRCNLISVSNDIIVSHCGGDLSQDECLKIMDIIKRNYDNDTFRFYSTGTFRNLLVIKDNDAKIVAKGPHELLGHHIKDLNIESGDSNLSKQLNEIIESSFSLLKDYKANGIALWGPGKEIKIPYLTEGSLITGTTLVKGIGKAIGMNVIDVEGATGNQYTDLSGKLRAAKNELKNTDFVVLHIESADEFSHRRDWMGKIEFLEKIDREILSQLLSIKEDIMIRVQADHATSSLSGKHLRQSVQVIEYINL